MARTTSKTGYSDSYGNEQKSNVLNGYTQGAYESSGDPSYFGFVDTEGNWYIQKITSGASTYIRGTSNFATNWTNRASLTPYVTFDQAF